MVGATNNLFGDPVAKRTQSLEERPIRLTGFRLERLAICPERTPSNEFRDVLDDDIFDVELLRPLNDTPGRNSLLIFDRPPATSNGVECAFGRCHEQMQTSPWHNISRPDFFDPRTDVLRPRIVF